MASQEGHTDVLTLLLEKGADVNLARNDGSTPAFMASQMGHADVLTLLLEKGADVNLTNNNGSTPAFIASLQGHTDVLTLLLEKGADVNLTNNRGQNALISASAFAKTDAVVLLLKHGAAIDVAMTADADGLELRGKTALMLAAQKGHFAEAKLLVDAGADQTKRDELGKVHPVNYPSRSMRKYT
jgi:ankyrin repeat protein